ncbi:hypothetical protein [Spongiactinospora sp. 9N601]|uniref:hypothetical protein n=1 Tax=Spongiactinospora sp. 9N601 TaxID=3375149 RepID=UPI0037BD1EE3
MMADDRHMVSDDQHDPCGDRRRRAVPGRARRRAIRARAAMSGVPYSVAARWPEAWPGQCETPASRGRTIYPAGTDGRRRRLIGRRARRTFHQRVQDARMAADLPRGRARHLVERFPPARGDSGTGVGPLYHGEAREDVLALAYFTVAAETRSIVPAPGELAWTAELGEETAVDTMCALIDRMVRLALDAEPATLRHRAAAAILAGAAHRGFRTRDEAARLAAAIAPHDPARWAELPFTGARQILDALLVVAEDGHAPGTRVRITNGPRAGSGATIVGAMWGLTGPPLAYRVHPDRSQTAIVADPDDLVVLTRDSGPSAVPPQEV